MMLDELELGYAITVNETQRCSTHQRHHSADWPSAFRQDLGPPCGHTDATAVAARRGG